MANFNYYKNRAKQLTLTEWLIGINVVMYAITFIVDATVGNALLHLGAKVNFLVAGGQYYRLLTSMFLHAGITHLIFNMMALYILGRDIERFFGKGKFLAIYFGAGLLGSALSYLTVDAVSVGASGAIFGLMGANLYLYKRNPMVYKRIYGTDLLILIGINLLIGFVRPNIDIAGHIGGLIGGFLLAESLGLKNEIWRNVKGILFLALYAVITFGIIGFATFLNFQSEIFYMNMTYYTYLQSHMDQALKWAERGLSKFPNSSELLQFKSSYGQ
ncbi:MAG: rhomboid protease GluP [Clostridiales bacterium]|jgi:rhomboid protease GluP|nr:rhomboid protease GluP [Clostridiales bacterium]MDN5298253.1 rhomboid protease GluP [Clostridiales bacterium]